MARTHIVTFRDLAEYLEPSLVVEPGKAKAVSDPPPDPIEPRVAMKLRTQEIFVDMVVYDNEDGMFYGAQVDSQTGDQVIIHQYPRESVHHVEMLLTEPD